MAIELIVPKVGESITEVQIVEWLVKEGDAVARDQNLAVIETDKATVELPAPVAGVLTKIVVTKGTVAKVGQLIGYLEPGEGKGTAPKSTAANATAASAASAPAASTPVGSSQVGSPASPNAGTANSSASTSSSTNPAKVMPAAARVLAEQGLSADEVKATGPGNRLLKEDVLRHVEAKAQAASTATPAPPAAPTGSATSDPATTATTISSTAATSPMRAASTGTRTEEIVPMSMLRKKVAERLVSAQQNAALLTTFNEIDMSVAMDLRKRHQENFVKKFGTKLGFMSFFVKAAVDALKLIPQMNAEIRGENIIYKHYYDIGVAVGGGKGLVVPIIRSADALGFAEVEQTIADFGKRAQANAIKLEELQGGTFTISNGGVYGSLLSTPIVNPPQSGVLGLHAIQDRPVAREGQVVIRPMMYVALTYDHRIVDGKEAVTFLKRVKDTLEDPARMLLEI